MLDSVRVGIGEKGKEKIVFEFMGEHPWLTIGLALILFDVIRVIVGASR